MENKNTLRVLSLILFFLFSLQLLSCNRDENNALEYNSLTSDRVYVDSFARGAPPFRSISTTTIKNDFTNEHRLLNLYHPVHQEIS